MQRPVMPDSISVPVQGSRALRRAAALPSGLAPLFLSRTEAAAYLGVSPETFTREVQAGWWPAPVRRGDKSGSLTWYRPALEHAAQAQHLVTLNTDPTAIDARAAAEAEAMKGLHHAKASLHGGQRRQAKGA